MKNSILLETKKYTHSNLLALGAIPHTTFTSSAWKHFPSEVHLFDSNTSVGNSCCVKNTCRASFAWNVNKRQRSSLIIAVHSQIHFPHAKGCLRIENIEFLGEVEQSSRGTVYNAFRLNFYPLPMVTRITWKRVDFPTTLGKSAALAFSPVFPVYAN